MKDHNSDVSCWQVYSKNIQTAWSRRLTYERLLARDEITVSAAVGRQLFFFFYRRAMKTTHTPPTIEILLQFRREPGLDENDPPPSQSRTKLRPETTVQEFKIKCLYKRVFILLETTISSRKEQSLIKNMPSFPLAPQNKRRWHSEQTTRAGKLQPFGTLVALLSQQNAFRDWLSFTAKQREFQIRGTTCTN